MPRSNSPEKIMKMPDGEVYELYRGPWLVLQQVRGGLGTELIHSDDLMNRTHRDFIQDWRVISCHGWQVQFKGEVMWYAESIEELQRVYESVITEKVDA